MVNYKTKYLTFGRCPSCNKHIFFAKMRYFTRNKNKMNLDKSERKVMLCPFCGVELKEHPASRYMFLVVLIIT